MEYRYLGNSGLQVSVVGLGCNNFGGRLDARQTADVINKCVDMGITFFDTADVYGGRGKSEEFMGPAIKPHRRNIVLATKSFSPMGEGPYWQGASRKYIMDAVEDCMRRLETDYIDLYQMHRPDPKTPIEETLRALEDLVRSGKVRYIGSSNYAAWQVVEAHFTSKENHLSSYISAQNEYSLLQREPEQNGLTAVCEKFNVGLLPFFPLASGFLTGKYRPGEPAPEGSRLSGASPMAARFLKEDNYDTLMKLEGFAQERGHTMVELAISWLASKPYVGSVIAGATRPEQVEENARSGDWRLNNDEMAEIDAIMGV
ncbi:MAG: aldo/keto reductase [Dehalococcoidia bacterium]|nr:aldo/keto reductase [Dehalococcoidia bacterium]